MKKIIAIAVILAGVVLLTIGNTIQMYSTISIIEKRLADKEHAVQELKRRTEADSAKAAKVHTRTFEEETAIVEGMVEAEKKVIYKSLWEIPDVEYNSKDNTWYRTLISYPNGMPKILAAISRNDKYNEYWISGVLFTFLDENGREIAEGQHSKRFGNKWRWLCRSSNNEVLFDFKDPNLCRNLK